MALKDLLTVASGKKNKKVEVDKEKIKENLKDYQKLIDYWRKYPDKFVDYLCSLNPDNTFKFYYVQRLYLRISMRYKTVYAVFSRGFSKSFLAVLCLMIKAVLYPGSKLATVADGKGQSAAILSSKMTEICQLIPAFANEIIWDTRGKIAQTTQSKDQVTYAFKNGSQLSNAAMTETTRGQRFQSILVEESAKVDQEKLTEIIMPTLVISRQINGEVDPNEVLNQSAIFVTSAGYKGTYAYEKLIDTLCHSVAGRDNEAFILGGDWKIPVVEGLQPANFIQAQENDNSMDEAGFDREYNSIWAGTVEGAFFNPQKFDQHRVLQLAQTQYDHGTSKDGYYCMGVDVGRLGDMTEVVVIKVTPARTGVSLKQVVNIYTFEEDHFEKQAIQLKRLFSQFKCDMCVVDGNGINKH